MPSRADGLLTSPIFLGLLVGGAWLILRGNKPADQTTSSSSSSESGSGSGSGSGAGSGSGSGGSGSSGLTLTPGTPQMPGVTYPNGYFAPPPNPQNYQFYRPQWAANAFPALLGRAYMFYFPRWYRVHGNVLAEAGIYEGQEHSITWDAFIRYPIDGRELTHLSQVTPGGHPPDQPFFLTIPANPV